MSLSSFSTKNKLLLFVVAALFLIALPLFAQQFGNSWVRIMALALLYVLLALGLNIVVGYAGLLDLGYVAFYAVGAYMYALLASPHLPTNFPWIASLLPGGMHTPIWAVIPLAALLAAAAGVLLGTPVLKLRGDYLAIVTLGFGEIIRVFMNNLEQPINITNGPRGIDSIDSMSLLGLDFGKPHTIGEFRIPSVTLYYYLFLALVVFSVVVCFRLERSRIGRAWMAIREDEIAAKAMGINTRNMKLLAFGMGASFGGVSGSMFAAFQGFVSPESFALNESVMIVAMIVLGGLGHIPGVILGAVMLAALPEILRHVAGPLQQMTGGRLDASILRQLLIALAMIGIMLSRPRGLWPSPEHGKGGAAPGRAAARARAARAADSARSDAHRADRALGGMDGVTLRVLDQFPEPAHTALVDAAFSDYEESELLREVARAEAAARAGMQAPAAARALRIGAFRGETLVGWTFACAEGASLLTMVNSGVAAAERRQGIYTELVRMVIAHASSQGDVAILSRHAAGNNAVIVAKLKLGFIVSGFEYSEVYGPLVRLTLLLGDLRRSLYKARSTPIRRAKPT